MEKVIFKYSVCRKGSHDIVNTKPGDFFTMEIPKGAQILCVKEQAEQNEQGAMQMIGKIWALIDPAEEQKEKRIFCLVMAGQKFDDRDLEYIGTYQVDFGKIILHLFEYVGI